MDKNDQMMLYALLSLIVTITAGTFAYSYLEGWTLTEALFFTASTVSTVGYGTLAPSPENRLFTAFFIIICTTLVLACIAVIGNWIVSRIQHRNAIRRIHFEALRIHAVMEKYGQIDDDEFNHNMSKISDDVSDEIKKL